MQQIKNVAVLVVSFSFAACLLLSLALRTAHSQNPGDIAQADRLTHHVVSFLKNRLKNYQEKKEELNPFADMLIEKTHIIFEKTGATPVAFSFVSPAGDFFVVISAQLVLQYYYTAEFSIPNSLEKDRWQPCEVQYSEYLVQRYIRATLRERLHEKVRIPLPPEDFAKDYGGACTGLEFTYPIPLRLRPIRNQHVANAIAFTILQELGYIYYDDAPKNIAITAIKSPVDLNKYLRAACINERSLRRSDAFAATTLVKMGLWQAADDQTIWQTIADNGPPDPRDYALGGSIFPLTRDRAVLEIIEHWLEEEGNPAAAALSGIIKESRKFEQGWQAKFPPHEIYGLKISGCGQQH